MSRFFFILVDQALNSKKYSSNIITCFSKNFLCWNFQKLLRIMYPEYQLYTLVHRITFNLPPWGPCLFTVMHVSKHRTVNTFGTFDLFSFYIKVRVNSYKPTMYTWFKKTEHIWTLNTTETHVNFAAFNIDVFHFEVILFCVLRILC